MRKRIQRDYQNIKRTILMIKKLKGTKKLKVITSGDTLVKDIVRDYSETFTQLKEFDMKKETNPKDAVGIRKVPMSCVSAPVVMEMALGMMEGARKYGRHNYRIAGVRASVYYDAAMRHLMLWWEGQDIDPDSGISHISKAMSALHVLRDAMMNEMWTDDRPPVFKNQEWVNDMNKKSSEIIDKYPDSKPPFVKE